MVIDGTTISIEIQKTGARRLSVQGKPYGIGVNLSLKQLDEAYETLSDSEKRREYDTNLKGDE